MATITTACAAPWSQPSDRLQVVSLPSPTPLRLAPVRLRVVLGDEGVASLDAGIRQLVGEAARDVGAVAEVQDMGAFLGDDGSVAHRLLAAVQAGVPPHAVLLPGRQAQTARFHAMELVQDVSALMGRTRRRFEAPAQVSEQWHVVAGNWFGAPWYQRLVGHWAHTAPFRDVGLDPTQEVSYAQLARALSAATKRGASVGNAAPSGGAAGWGIGAADTPDVDTWCWSVIHSFGGALADRAGARVVLDSPQTAEALTWMAAALAEASAGGALPAEAGAWMDGEKNATFLASHSAYTYTRRLLDVGPSTAPSARAGAPDVADLTYLAYLAAPAGPMARARGVDGGAIWYVPRGMAPDMPERLLERLLDSAQQRRLWEAGRGLALPAYDSGWNDAALAQAVANAPGGEPSVRRFHAELAPGGLISASGANGPETAASLAVAETRLAARMLRATLTGRSPTAVAAEAQQAAVAVFRDYGLPGA